MAEEQVMPQTLVLQNDYDKLALTLQNHILDKKVDAFFRAFSRLSYSFFGFDKNQLKEFSINELKALDKLISRKARPWAIFQMILTLSVPIFGWIHALGMFLGKSEYYNDYPSWFYIRQRKYLRNHKEDFMLEIFQKLKS